MCWFRCGNSALPPRVYIFNLVNWSPESYASGEISIFGAARFTETLPFLRHVKKRRTYKPDNSLGCYLISLNWDHAEPAHHVL
uniref:Uncharacterized protein n=1 Tax=Murine herpesvirus TaxID=1431748 RepID=A0A6M4EHT0_9BETA